MNTWAWLLLVGIVLFLSMSFCIIPPDISIPSGTQVGVSPKFILSALRNTDDYLTHNPCMPSSGPKTRVPHPREACFQPPLFLEECAVKRLTAPAANRLFATCRSRHHFICIAITYTYACARDNRSLNSSSISHCFIRINFLHSNVVWSKTTSLSICNSCLAKVLPVKERADQFLDFWDASPVGLHVWAFVDRINWLKN